MLDLTSLFNIIDHLILLNRLEFYFSIQEKSITWEKSYLPDLTWCDWVEDKTSSDKGLHFDVPQGSVLRQMNYCLYTKQIGEIIKHNTKCQCYVDDNLVYTPFKSLDKWDDSSSSVEDCTANINIWIDRNIMKLNKD